jgi:hypothetical protein
MGEGMAAHRLQVAVITGEHPFDVPGFHRFLAALPSLECFVQDLDNFAWDATAARARYDVLLFFNYHWGTPGSEGGWWQRKRAGVLETLGETPQGIFVLHHALAAFPRWPVWSELVGIPHAARTYPPDIAHVLGQLHFDQTIPIAIADPAHPITRGLAPWDLRGETWGALVGEPGPDNHILLRTHHPRMQLTAMAWTRRFRRAPVFCLHPGHDADTWDDPHFRIVVERACHWLAAQPAATVDMPRSAGRSGAEAWRA